MTPAPFGRDDLLRLCERYCAGDLDDAGAERLAAALRDDAGARRTFLQYMDLHSALAWESSSAADLDAAISLRQRQPSPRSRQPLARRAAQLLFSTPKRIALTIATLALAVVLGVMASTPAPLVRALRWGQTSDETIVTARVSAAIDCEWEANNREIARGTKLLAGQRLHLAEGTVELTFVDGAVVTLTGPATIVVETPARAALDEGKLAARVAEAARGFTIRTPGATIVDLGTEFGVSVPPRDEETGQPLGREEVHVFTGAVEVQFTSDALSPQRLLANEALRFASSAAGQAEEGGLERLAATQRARFPRTIDADGELTTAAPLPPEKHPPVTRGLVLWLAADGAIRCTSTGHVAEWEDMLAGDNRQAQPAKQHFPHRRPVWVSDAFNGQPAIRFDGDDYLALVGPDKFGISGEPYEMYIVARTSSPAVQFLIAGGTEEFEVHVNGAAGETGARFIPTGYFNGDGASDVGSQDNFSDGRPHLYVARVEADRSHRGVLAVDGRETSDPTVDDARGYSDLPLRLGMRADGQYGLSGELAEVLVYRAALAGAERRDIERFFASKYAISWED